MQEEKCELLDEGTKRIKLSRRSDNEFTYIYWWGVSSISINDYFGDSLFFFVAQYYISKSMFPMKHT